MAESAIWAGRVFLPAPVFPAVSPRFAPLLSLLLLSAGACVAAPATLTPVATGAAASVQAGDRAYRWAPATLQPLRVYVQPRSELAGWSPRHTALVDRAFRAW